MLDKVFIVLTGEVMINNVIPRILTEKEKRREERKREKEARKKLKELEKKAKARAAEEKGKAAAAESVNLGAEPKGETDADEK